MNEKTMSLPFGGLQVVEESGVAFEKINRLWQISMNKRTVDDLNGWYF